MAPAPRTRSLQVVTLALGLLCPAAVWAQSVAAGDSALARRDTNSAISAYEAAIAKRRDDAEAHYKAGILYLARIHPRDLLSIPRQKAEEHLKYATRFNGDSAKYFVALADAYRTETNVGPRAQVAGLIAKAAEVARLHPTPLTAEIEMRAARIEWGRYEFYAHHYLFTGDNAVLNVGRVADDWPYVEHFVQDEIGKDPGDPGANARDAAETDLRGALKANPGHIRSAGLLAILMGEQGRWAEAIDAGRHLVRAVPDSGAAWAVLGMALARGNRWREAQGVYDTALARMTPTERAPYENLALVLTTDQRRRWADVPQRERPKLDSLFWASAQPLFLWDRNEARTEFYVRLTYVLHRWSDPLRGLDGFISDPGNVYIRYGEPDVWVGLGGTISAVGAGVPDLTADNMSSDFLSDSSGGHQSEGQRTLWVYWHTQHRFVFTTTRGFAQTAFIGGSREFYRDAQIASGVRFDNVQIEHTMDTIDVQVAQFRGDQPNRTDLAIYSLMPVGRMVASSPRIPMDLETGLIMRDGAAREIVRQPQKIQVHGGDSVQIDRRSWRASVRPSRYQMHVEAMLPATEQAARSSSYLTVRPFTGDTLDISDVIIANRVAPHDSSASRWSDFLVEPSSGRLSPTESFGLLWEVYNLVPDAGSVAHYRVDLRLTIKSIERHGFAATVLGGLGDAVGLSARGDKAVALGFDRQVPVAPHGRQVEYLTITLKDAPNALYDLVVQVTDKATGRVVSQAKPLIVSPTPLSR